MIEHNNLPWPYIITDELMNSLLIEQLEDRALVCIASNRFGLLHDVEMPEIDLTAYKNKLENILPHLEGYEIHSHLAINHSKYEYHTHFDHPNKLASIITHVYPMTNLGTMLHETQDGPSVKDIPWKVGSSTIIENQPHVSWHSYRSDGKSPRVTFNSFFVKPGTNPTGRPE